MSRETHTVGTASQVDCSVTALVPNRCLRFL